jgi:hypothetical protein
MDVTIIEAINLKTTMEAPISCKSFGMIAPDD